MVRFGFENGLGSPNSQYFLIVKKKVKKTDDKKKDFLMLGKDPTQLLNDTTLTEEAE